MGKTNEAERLRFLICGAPLLVFPSNEVSRIQSVEKAVLTVKELTSLRRQQPLLKTSDTLRVGRDLAGQPGQRVFCARLRLPRLALDKLQPGANNASPIGRADDSDTVVIIQTLGQLQFAAHLIDVRVALSDLIFAPRVLQFQYSVD